MLIKLILRSSSFKNRLKTLPNVYLFQRLTLPEKDSERQVSTPPCFPTAVDQKQGPRQAQEKTRKTSGSCSNLRFLKTENVRLSRKR